MTRTDASPPDPPAVGTYTVPDVAGLLKCTQRHVRDLVATGVVPGVIRVGRLIRFHKGIVHDWLATQATGVARG